MISGLDEGLHYHLSWLNWSEQKRLFELKTRRCHSSHFLPRLLEQTPSCNYNSIGGGGGVIINPLCSTSARFNENKAGGGALFEWYDQMQLCGLWRTVRKKKWNRRDCWPRLFLIRADQYPLVSWSSLSLFCCWLAFLRHGGIRMMTRVFHSRPHVSRLSQKQFWLLAESCLWAFCKVIKLVDRKSYCSKRNCENKLCAEALWACIKFSSKLLMDASLIFHED